MESHALYRICAFIIVQSLFATDWESQPTTVKITCNCPHSNSKITTTVKLPVGVFTNEAFTDPQNFDRVLALAPQARQACIEKCPKQNIFMPDLAASAISGEPVFD